MIKSEEQRPRRAAALNVDVAQRLDKSWCWYIFNMVGSLEIVNIIVTQFNKWIVKVLISSQDDIIFFVIRHILEKAVTKFWYNQKNCFCYPL